MSAVQSAYLDIPSHWKRLSGGVCQILCRTKLAVSTDAAALFENLDWKTFGKHRVAFFVNHRQKLKEVARHLGYEAVEKDR